MNINGTYTSIPLPIPKCGLSLNIYYYSRTFTSGSNQETPLLNSAKQGSEEYAHITTLASTQHQDVVSLRTVPVWISANDIKIKVNALLDDASSVSYVNEELAGVLGLSATYEQVTVNVLNETVQTFDSMPVRRSLESCDGNVKTTFEALTCPRRVTGSYKAVDGSKFQDRCPHLRVCKFPEAAPDPIVDLLIGQDQIDLHFAKVDVRGKPEEPIARLAPLQWSCVGCPEGNASTKIHRTNLACTFFSRPHIFDELNDSMKRFWEFDTLGAQENGVKAMTREEKIALDKVQVSLVHDGERYQVATPWKPEYPMLPNNYEMAYCRLRNTKLRWEKTIRELSHPTSKRVTSAKYPKPNMSRNVSGMSLISLYAVQGDQQQRQESYLMPARNFNVLP